MMAVADRLLAAGMVPDAVLRRIIRARVRRVVDGLDAAGPDERRERQERVLAAFEAGPIATNTDDANAQHYEVPAEFFEMVLGPRLKYSSCYWPAEVTDLAAAEEAMLRLTVESAGIEDGQDILDLGCGWGSLSLWLAERFPASRIVAVSNSAGQRRFIEERCRERHSENLRVVTAEVGSFDPPHLFDRVVSVEMLEHVRNHRELMGRISGWLRPGGRLFVHIFCHARHLYAFEPGGTAGWMAGRFFTGGIMPSWDYLPRYQEHLRLIERWTVDGRHYARTLRAWLERLDQNRSAVMPVLRSTYGSGQARLWSAYWRLFFMACEETFALGQGTEYFVGHYLFEKPAAAPTGQAIR